MSNCKICVWMLPILAAMKRCSHVATRLIFGPLARKRRSWNAIRTSEPAVGVLRSHTLFNRFRKVLVRYEKKTSNYFALVQFACAVIVWRKFIRIHC